MNIKYLPSGQQLQHTLDQYNNQYDRIFYITQESILLESSFINKVIKNQNIYICSENENCKSIDEYQKCIKYLYQNQCNRNSLIIAIGGGSVTDFCGFIASSYMRGLSYIAIPSTLLGMVDASIGGKTALNFQGIRNLIGTYKVPNEIIIIPELINTLKKGDIINGCAEIVKYSLIMDKKLFLQIEEIIDDILSKVDIDFISPFIKTCIGHKLKVVEQDMYDHGERNILNFGHTVGHALESYYEFNMPHGTAILYGMQVASYLSYQQNYIKEGEYNRISNLIKKFGLKKLNLLDYNRVLEFINADKKNMGNQLNYILLKEIGTAIIEQNYNKNLIGEALKIL